MKLNLPHYQFNIKKNDKGALVIFDHLRQRFITLTPEEWVRQNFVRFLIEEKQFPTALMGNEVSLLKNGRAGYIMRTSSAAAASTEVRSGSQRI